MTALGSVDFTDRDVGLISAELPAGCDPRRVELLPQILREWARRDLQEYFERESPLTKRKYRDRRERLARLGGVAVRLLEMVDGLDRGDRLTLAAQIGIAAGQRPFEAIFSKANEERVGKARDYIALVAAGGRLPLEAPTRGQPRNILSYLIMMDLAAIYEWLVDADASRRVDRITHEEAGPFREFAGALWSVVFHSDDRLSAALKNWAEARKKYGESSPVMFNMDLRHPEWGLFGSE